MGRQLAAHVHVPDPDTGEIVVFGPKDRLPAWAATAITNPAAWRETDDEDQAETEANTPPDPEPLTKKTRRAPARSRSRAKKDEEPPADPGNSGAPEGDAAPDGDEGEDSDGEDLTPSDTSS